MERHFEEDFDRIKGKILMMGSLVEDQIRNALIALV